MSQRLTKTKRHGALLILDSSAHTVPDYKDKEDTEKQSKVSISERGEIVTEEVKTVVEEDALDVDLYKVDGWIRLREDAKETKLDDFVAVLAFDDYLLTPNSHGTLSNTSHGRV